MNNIRPSDYSIVVASPDNPINTYSIIPSNTIKAPPFNIGYDIIALVDITIIRHYV